MQYGTFFLVLGLTNNRKKIYCTALIIQKEFFTTPFLLRISPWGGGEGLWLQSQGDQDLYAVAAVKHLIFKTHTEEQTVDLTNKDMTKDSQRFSRWFHSPWMPGVEWREPRNLCVCVSEECGNCCLLLIDKARTTGKTYI